MSKSDSELFPFSISAVGDKTGLTARQIRYYEKMGLIEPHRTSGNQRRYSSKHIRALNRIKELIAEHQTIDGVRDLLASEADTLPKEIPPVPSDTAIRKPLSSIYPVSNRAVLQEILQATQKQNSLKDRDTKG